MLTMAPSLNMILAAVGGVDITTASYDSKSYDVSSQDAFPGHAVFKDDGTKMYVAGVANGTVYQYSLSTAWDVSTASYDGKSLVVNAGGEPSCAVAFKPDGTKLYYSSGGDDLVYQYSLSTAWDVSTASYDSKSFDGTSQDAGLGAVRFKDDGTKMYMIGIFTDSVYQYSLSTAWDVSTASYDSKSLDTSVETNLPLVFAFSSTGAQIFVCCNSTDAVYQYDLSTAWDVSTGSYASKSFDPSSQDTQPIGIEIADNDARMYLTGFSGDSVYQYTLG